MRLYIFIIFITMLLGCTSKNSFHIEDVGRDSVIVINSGNKNPSVFKFIITGHVDDTCKVLGMKFGKGRINDTVFYDQYNKVLNFKYEAYKARKGTLNISYSFE